MSTVQAPTKGVRPSTTGVPGILMDAAPPDLLFGERKNRAASPYDALLIQLKGAGHGKFLKFEDVRARVSVIARAKKLGIKVMFGEQGQTLWVTLAKVELQTGGVTEAQPTAPTYTDVILSAIKLGKDTAGTIITWARSNGAAGIGLTQAEEAILTLARTGKIKMKDRKRGDDIERWSVA